MRTLTFFFFWKLQIVKAFLPEMISSQRGHIVTVASVAGILGTYRCSDYSATKFAACGFHEVLYTELQVKKIIKSNFYFRSLAQATNLNIQNRINS
jgi:short-subunit dehydrogenase